MSRKFLLIIFIITAFGIGLYAYLGGFKTATVTKTKSDTVIIAGKYYEGPLNGEELGVLFREAAQLIENKKINGTLANIYYNNPEADQDSIKAFIGIRVTDSASVALPAGYILRRFAGGQPVLQSTVNAHYIVSPNKVYPALFDYLKEHKLKTEPPYLELFPDKNSILVQVKLKP